MAEGKEGWAWPSNARKAHYYGNDSRSLCGKWLLFPGMQGQPEQGNDDSPDNCAGCRKALKAKKEVRNG